MGAREEQWLGGWVGTHCWGAWGGRARECSGRSLVVCAARGDLPLLHLSPSGAMCDSSVAETVNAASGATEAIMCVGQHRVELDPRVREMSAGVYEGLPRGTTHQEAVRAKARQAGLSVQEFVRASGGVPTTSRSCPLRAPVSRRERRPEMT